MNGVAIVASFIGTCRMNTIGNCVYKVNTNHYNFMLLFLLCLIGVGLQCHAGSGTIHTIKFSKKENAHVKTRYG